MARKKRKRIASRGSVNTTILKTLITGDKYGYEIIKEVEEFSDGKIVLKQPSLYSSLSRFEEKGIVSSYWGDSDIGGRRHYYHLTDIGHKYYNENVLKQHDDEDVEDNPTTVTNPIASSEVSVTPIEKEAIPDILGFDVKPEKEIIPDHNFYTQTPIENNLDFNRAQQTSVEEKHSQREPDSIHSEDLELMKKLAEKVKISNNRASTTPFKTLHVVKPKKAQKVILDSDGIFKLRDEDYVSKKSTYKEKIVDNVIKRSNPTIYGYPSYTESKNNPVQELTEEEKQRKNQLFIEKFHNLTQPKLKIVEEKPAPQSIVKEDKDIDYRSKLNSVIENSNKDTNTFESPRNNLFEYDNDEEKAPEFERLNDIAEDTEDKFIDFEPVEFSVKNDNSHYEEEISNIAVNNSVNLNRYEHKTKPIADEKSYVLINKVRLIFGFILALFLTLELSISYFVFKNFDLLIDGDNKFYVILSVISLIISVSYIVPYFINKTQHTYNNFKLKYSLMLGILAFLVLLILIYCLNALMGFELDNFKYFAVRLVVPAILSFNFVLMPPIYALIIKNKNFYD